MEELYSRAQVEDTVNRLFIETDNKNWSAVDELFTPQVRFDMTSLAGGKPEVLAPVKITDMWRDGLTPVAAVHHQSGNFLVNVKENEADVFCYGTATHYKNPVFKKKTVVSFVGSYNFHLVRQGETWRIESLKFNKKYVE
jgi:hypothetical protein